MIAMQSSVRRGINLSLAALLGAVKVPALRFLALWHAITIAVRVRQGDYVEPDAFSTEQPFIADGWPGM